MILVRNTLVATALCAFASASQAASDGEFGHESTGTNRISLTIRPSLKVSEVDDIAINVSRRDADALHTEELCVRVNGGSSYFVMAHTDAATEPRFLLRNQDEQSLAFEVRYRSDMNKSAGELLQPNVRSRLQYSPQAGSSCDGGSSAAFGLRFPATHLSTAGPGIYRGQLTLTVATE